MDVTDQLASHILRVTAIGPNNSSTCWARPLGTWRMTNSASALAGGLADSTSSWMYSCFSARLPSAMGHTRL